MNKGFSLTSQLKINTLKHKHTTLSNGTEVCEQEEEYNHSANNENDSLTDLLQSIELFENVAIDMISENFMNIYEDIYGNPYNYDDRTINMKGFIYKQEGLNKDEFILSRIQVSCCTADAQLVGILCNYTQEEVIAEGTWVNIEGTLGHQEYKDVKSGEVSVIPIIKVNKIEKIDAKDSDYIYN
jgi:putative membrane protein